MKSEKQLKPLSDEELGNVAGGGRSGGSPEPTYGDWERMAKLAFPAPVYVPFPCPYCHAVSKPDGRYSVWAHYYSDYHNEYRFATCFACGREGMHITNGEISG